MKKRSHVGNVKDFLRRVEENSPATQHTMGWNKFWRGIFYLNPKTPGLFGPSDTRGGAAAAHFRERRLELPNFHFCPQTVFHMKAGIFS